MPILSNHLIKPLILTLRYFSGMSIDELYMNRALTLARRGVGHVSPNPPVGAVIVHRDRILGEGYHEKYGEAHAEVNAVRSVDEADKHLLSESTIYVTLEPCNFYGKTPPCVDLLLKHRFKRVVIAILDPHPKVSGTSVEKLKAAGVEVTAGVCAEEAAHITHAFITHHTLNRPYYILKWAQTKDGFMGSGLKPVSISNSQTQILTHKWRSEIPAILIGVGTAIIDTPRLTDRFHGGPSPKIIIFDPKDRLAPDHGILKRTHLHANSSTLGDFISSAESIKALNRELIKHGIDEVLIEGGRATHQAWIEAQTWEEIRVFNAPDRNPQLDVPAPVLQDAQRVNRISMGNNFLDMFRPER